MRAIATVAGAAGLLLGLAAAPAPAFLSQDMDQEAAACVPPALRDRPVSSVTQAQRRAMISCAARAGARELNRQTPIRMGEGTLTSAIAAGTTLYYNFRLDVDAADYSAQDRAELAAGTRANVCAAPDMREVIALGGVYAYNWFDRSSRLIQQLRVDRCR